MKTLIALLALLLTSSVASGEIYTWRDGKGTRFYTNSLHEIPARYLKKAKVLDVATGKVGGPATASAGAAGAPSTTARQEEPSQPQPQQVQLAPPASATQPAPPASPVAAPASQPDPAVTRAARGSTVPGQVEGARTRRQVTEQGRATRRRGSASDE